MNDLDEAVIDKTDIEDDEEFEEPKDYKIIFWNDNYSSFDLVKLCLEEICHKSKEEANQITLEVHQKGKGIGYIGTYDICLTKQVHITALAHQFEMPLRITVEEA